MSEKTKVIEYYSNLSETYDKIRFGNTKGRIIGNLQNDWIVKNLRALDSKCLEIGCGTGRVTQIVVGVVSNLVAVDCSVEMIKINKNKNRLNTLKDRIEYVQCDASYLPFRCECFDEVVGSRVFWHIPDYVVALQEAIRVVKSKHPVLFDFPNVYGPFSVYSKLCRIKQDVLTYFVNRKTVKILFKKFNYVIIDNSTTFFLYIAPEKILQRKIIRGILYRFEKPRSICFEDLLYSYFLIKVIK